jgi:hypothetical protein
LKISLLPSTMSSNTSGTPLQQPHSRSRPVPVARACSQRA